MYGRGGMQDRYGSQGVQGWEGPRPSHRGKGPSGYTRSDERIRETVCEMLTEHHHVDATNIEVTVKNGEVMLGGSVEDRRQKRLAEDIAEQVSGVKDVQNQIRVMEKRGMGKEGQTTGKESEPSMTSDKRHRA
jgi:osmotically-inducible protein OsmY